MKHNHLLYLVATLLLFSCQKGEVLICGDDITVKMNCATGTKVDFDGSALSFTTGDKLSLNIEGVNSAELSNAKSGNVNSFEGKLLKKGIKKADAEWYVTYPSTAGISPAGIVTASLPTTQKAPYDKSALVMFSDVVTEDYDEDNIPALNFSLNHALGLIKITVTNTAEEYGSELIENIQFSSSSVLSGSFSLDIHDESPRPVFTGYGFNRIISDFQSDVALGVGEAHTVYLFANPVVLNECTLKVVTDKHIFTRESENTIDIEAGAITAFQLLNLGSFSVTERTAILKKVACWGDSYTKGSSDVSYPNNLQDLLGDSWIVYNGGISGNRVDEIAARQGGLGIVTNEEFTIPASGSVTVNGGILRTRNNACEEGYFHMRKYGGAMANPCLINGIECNVTSSSSSNDIDDPSTTFTATITRIGSGDPVVIPAHTPIISYGARTTKDVDLQIIYMGANGRVVYNGKLGDANYYDNLVQYHRYMIEFNTNKNDYIILGYHNAHWEQHYYERFSDEFGTRMIDLRNIIPSRGRELMVRTGAFPDEASIPQSELDRVDNGDWPYCFWKSTTDSHPSEYGARAIAIVIYERMVELGYID